MNRLSCFREVQCGSPGDSDQSAGATTSIEQIGDPGPHETEEHGKAAVSAPGGTFLAQGALPSTLLRMHGLVLSAIICRRTRSRVSLPWLGVQWASE